MAEQLRKQIEQRRAELAEMERQMEILQRAELYKQTCDALEKNPLYLPVYYFRKRVKNTSENIYKDFHRFITDFYPEIDIGRNNLPTRGLVTAVMELLIHSETETEWREYWIRQQNILYELLETYNAQWDR